ncbi:thiamine diphosphate-binding protein [Lactifluus volemus]|nr:thiamine diphosphate-binding protein [Lactifluus volemus]
MSFAAPKFRAISAPKASTPLTLSRSRSTAVASPSFLEAKARVKEHARNISRSSTHNAVVSQTVRPAPVPAFQPVPSKTNLPPRPAPALPSHPDTPLDHSFIGMSGGDIFHEMMLRHNVKHIFGYPGGAILPVFDAIYNSKHFDFILPRHEQGAGHMAEGYARVSGKPGVILVTSGPGATNVVTPMQDALSDGVPLVVFCGQVATSAIGSDAFQEADIVGISRSCTKWNVMVKDIAELPRRINEAFKIATSGRDHPGFSLDLPANPLHVPVRPTAVVELIRQAAQLINQANGHSFMPEWYSWESIGPKFMTQLAREGNIPVTTTLQGLGSFDETDPKSLHMLGMHGKVSQFAPAARAAAAQGRGGIIHFEIQPKNVNKVVDASIPILGDVTENLAALLPLVKFSERAAWFKDINEWKTKYPFVYVKSNPKKGEKMKPQEVIEELDRQSASYKEDVIISTGVGQHQMWAAQHFRWRYPRSMVTSGGLGTMGFGLPAAVGAKVAAPNKTVIDIDGDASFSMTAMELATASQFNIGVKVLVLNNEFQGMVVQWQDLFYDHRYSHTRMVNPDFVLLAKSMGVHAIRASSADELPEKMKEFLEHDGHKPVLLECVVEPSEHVFPMVPAGKALHEQILHPEFRDKK